MGSIVVGTDLSPRSDRGLLRAISIAKATGNEIVLVTVLEGEAAGPEARSEQRRAASALQRLQEALSEREGIACRVEVRSGDPAEELNKVADEAGAELMVIGPDRRGFFKDAFGSVTAERIVRAATVPLIVAKGSPWSPYRKILLPVDLSDSWQAKLEEVGSLAWLDGTQMTLLHIHDPEGREMMGRSLVTASARKAYLDDCRSSAQNALRDFARIAGQDRALLQSEEASGPVFTTVARVAEEGHNDLIVVTPSGKGFLGRYFLGSTTEDIIRSSLVDVLVLPNAKL
jgi:nucleotide-binding universal stress UspA family protein